MRRWSTILFAIDIVFLIALTALMVMYNGIQTVTDYIMSDKWTTLFTLAAIVLMVMFLIRITRVR